MSAPQDQSPGRVAFKIREFAEKFGHHATWGYRQVYRGNVAVIDMMGQLMIPASEVDRLVAQAKPYNPKPRKCDTRTRSNEKEISHGRASWQTH